MNRRYFDLSNSFEYYIFTIKVSAFTLPNPLGGGGLLMGSCSFQILRYSDIWFAYLYDPDRG